MYPRQDLVKSILSDLYCKVYFFYVHLYLCEYVWELVEEVTQMWSWELSSGHPEEQEALASPALILLTLLKNILPWKIFQ